MRQWLQIAFSYDAWANRQWAERLGRFENSQRATEIFEHILFAQSIWLERCGVVSMEPKRDQHLSGLTEASAQAWRSFLDIADLDEIITYETRSGDLYQNSVGQIALHVINHGTYHRGHLRGLADAEGWDDFQDTDLIRFFREHQANPVS